MMHKCPHGNAVPVLVPYMPVQGGKRKTIYVCSVCDRTDLWPVWTKTAPPLPSE